MSIYFDTSLTTAVAAIMAGTVLTASMAHAAPEIAISSPVGGSTTIVEQYPIAKPQPSLRHQMVLPCRMVCLMPSLK